MRVPKLFRASYGFTCWFIFLYLLGIVVLFVVVVGKWVLHNLYYGMF